MADIECARELFAELIVSATVQTGRPPSATEGETFAERALHMAGLLAAAQTKAGLPVPLPAVAPGQRDNRPEGMNVNFASVVEQWLRKAVQRKAGRSNRNLQSVFRRYVLPRLGERKINDIEPQEILAIVRSIEACGYLRTAYATFRDLRFLYRYALAAGLTDTDPTATLSRAITKPRSKGTKMIMDPSSVGQLLKHIRRYQGKPGSTAPYLLRLMPMLFLRASEIRTLEWRDVDLDAATIVVPAERMKMRRPHVVPLARQAVRLLQDVHKMTGAGRYVFTSGRTGDKPLDYGIFHVMLGRLGYGRVVSAHGFRVLASTWLNERGWPADVIERQLSHMGSDRTRRQYNHAEYLDRRRRMMQEWADHLEAVERKADQPTNTGRSFRPTELRDSADVTG